MTLLPVDEAPTLRSQAIRDLQAALTGDVIRPGDEAYDTARQVWNACVDKRPALIVRPAGTADVALAVNFARAEGLPVAVRGGGHGLAGHGVCDNGLMLDMSRMKAIQVDPEACTARLQAGVIGAELGRATGPHGLVMPGGQVPSTGVPGVLLGGGIGWLTRRYGLSCDNLLSAEIVTADGTVRTASAGETPDLFWALCGGGGNFGIVTELVVQLHPVSLVYGGMLLFPMEANAAVLRAYRDWVATAPDTLNSTLMFINVPPIPMVPAALHGTPAVAVGVCFLGGPEEGAALLAPLRALGPLVDMVAPMPFAVLQGLGEAGGHLGLQHDIRSGYLAALSDEAIDVMSRYTAALPGPLAQMHLSLLGGAMARVAPDATAFPHRDAQFLFNILPSWATPAEAEAQRAWMRDFAAALAPHATGGVYVNFLGDEGPDRVRAAYGTNYDRLAAIKRTYDPTNLFHLNQNIAPEA